MSVHLWIKNPHVKKPYAVPVGTVRRRKSNASLISDFIALRKTLCLCKTCEWRMPLLWKRRYGYWCLPGFHTDGSRCDGCQTVGPGNLYLAEEGGYLQQYFRAERIHANAQSQRLAVHDGRRIKGA